MADLTERFVANFHSITGETIAERRKKFRLLLSETKRSLKDESEDIDFSILIPENSFEEILKVEAIIFFRKVSDLMEILKSENPIHIAKVLKISSVFLEEAFGPIKGEELVDNIFPFLSFITKLKLLNKLALHLKNTQQIEEYFETVRIKYGLYLASKLLPGCGKVFIMKFLNTNRIEITSGQLMIIIKKYPEITEQILEALNNENNKISIAEKYKSVFIYLMENNACLFLKLNEKYNPTFTVGRRVTKKFICENKPKVVNDSQKIYKIFKKEQVFKNLKQEFKEFYLNLFPKTLSQCEEDFEGLLSLLEHTPSDIQKGMILLDTFKKIFGNDLWDYPKLITSKLMEIMSAEERELWMQTYPKPKEISEEDWISYMKIEKSLPLLKQRLSLTGNIKTRSKLVVYLLNTCKINKDKVALADVCKYMITKHQNDHYCVRQAFLRTLMSDFKLEQLEEDHWIHINKLIQFSIFNNENFYDGGIFLKSYIKYRLDKNLPVEEQLKQWVKFNYHRLSFDDPKYEMKYLPMLGNIIPLVCKESRLNFTYTEFLEHLSSWNEKHPNHQISLLSYPTAMKCFKASLKKDDKEWVSEQIIFQLMQETDLLDDEKLTILNDVFDFKTMWMKGTVIKWLLLNKPSYIRDNVEAIIKTILIVYPLHNLPRVWGVFKNYGHLEIPQKMCEILVKYVETKRNHVDSNELGIVVNALSNLMNPTDFIKLISSYYPSSLSVEIQNDDDQWRCNVQKTIGASVRNVLPPSLALESILNFSKGDYLGYVQKSLFLVSYNVAENKLPTFLKKLSTRAVSTRKHSIYLTIKTLNKIQICDMFENFMNTEKNSSILKCLFKGAFNFFINYPDDYSWELLKKIVLLLDINDNEAFKILTKWKRIPKKYIELYIVFAWEMLNKLSKSNNELEEKRGEIFDAITSDVVQLLSKEFCTQIIEQHLFKLSQSDIFQTKIQSFTSKCIIYSKLEQKFVFSLLKKFVTLTWYDSKFCKYGRTLIFNFVKNFCSNFLDKKYSNIEILNDFIKLWNDFLKPHEALEIYFYLHFTVIYLKVSTLLEIGEQLLMLYEKQLKENGFVINDSFEQTLKLFFKYFLLSDVTEVAEENRYILMKSLMENYESINRFMLITFLFPDDIPLMSKHKNTYEAVMQVLIKKEEPVIKIFLSKYYLQKPLPM